MQLYKIRVSGNVQGVAFRANAQQVANELGLTGFARNESDGSVYIEAEGAAPALQIFVEWCKQGSRSATVTHLSVTKHQPIGHQGFTIY